MQPTTLLHTGFPTRYLNRSLTLLSSRVVAVPTCMNSRQTASWMSGQSNQRNLPSNCVRVRCPASSKTASLSKSFPTYMIGTFEITKEKIFAQLFHVSARNFKLVFLRCLAQRLAQKLLRFFGHHALTHFHVFREFPQQRFRRFTRTSRHPVFRSRTNRLKLCSFNLLDRCSSNRLGDVRNPSMALRTFDTTRGPSNRSFGVHPSGCAYSCSPSRTSAFRNA